MMRFLRRCTFLDPRFRDLALLKEDEKEELLDLLVKESRDRHSDAAEPSQQNDPHHPPQTVKKSKMSLGSLLVQSSASTSQVVCINHRDASSLEIAQYEAIPIPHPDSDPLIFWRGNQTLFPLLSQLARKFLSSAATSCASERFFSITGHIVSKKRSCFKPEQINTLAFLAYNMKRCGYSSSK